MKKILVFVIFYLVFSIIHPSSVFADEFDNMMDVYGSDSRIKPVSEEEVQLILKKLEEKKNAPKKKTLWQKLFKKGEQPLKGAELAPSFEGSMITTPYLSLQVPCDMASEKSIIPVGFYTVEFDEVTSQLSFLQGHKTVAQVNLHRAPEKPSSSLYYVFIEKEQDYYKLFYGAIEKHYQALLYPM